MSVYLWIDALSLIGPLVLSFDKKVSFYKWWKHLFFAMAIMMALFIPWDIWFTSMGVWGFNEEYLAGISIFNLPIEEVLFFVVVPYACVFIYACLNYYVKKDLLEKVWKPVVLILSLALIAIACIYYNHLYTMITFTLTAFFLLYHVIKNTRWFSRFFLAYLVSLVPFLLVNGVLTGTGIDNEIVWYNTNHIIGVRIGTIPIEDTVYSLLMIGLTVHCLEHFRRTAVFDD